RVGVDAVEQAFQRDVDATQRLGRRARGLDVAAEVVLGLAQARVRRDRAALVGVLPIRDRAVEARAALAGHAGRELVEHAPEVLARVGLQCAEDLVDLHRRTGL